MATLSGGNQQKVVVARWMETRGQAAHSRGADHRRRRRLQGRDLSPVAALAATGTGRAADLLRFRGGRAHLPSRAGLQPRPRGRRKFRAERADHRAPDRRRASGGAAAEPHRSRRHEPTASIRPSPGRSRAPSRCGDCWCCSFCWSSCSRFCRPDTFLTYFNIRSILSNKSVQLLVALSVFIPMMANQFDLSAGFNVGISQVLAIGLQGQGWPWQAAVAAVSSSARSVGLVNGVLVTRVKIDSFIATLGTGTILYGLNAWYTGGQQVLAHAAAGSSWRSPAASGSFRRRRSTRSSSADAVDRVRVSAARPISLCARRQPARGGAQRHLGQALRHARPSSPPGRSPPSPASCCNRSCRSARVRSARNICCRHSPRPCSGATSIRPGRVNVWGTVLAVAVLAVTVAGLNQLGAPFFVEPLFNGSMLILAVGLAVQAAQRRQRRGTQADRAASVAATVE